MTWVNSTFRPLLEFCKALICISTKKNIHTNPPTSPQFLFYAHDGEKPPPSPALCIALTMSWFGHWLNASTLLRLLINLNNRLLLCGPQRKTDYPFVIDSSSSITFISRYFCSASFQLTPVLKTKKKHLSGFYAIKQFSTIIPLLLLDDLVAAAHINLFTAANTLSTFTPCTISSISLLFS